MFKVKDKITNNIYEVFAVNKIVSIFSNAEFLIWDGSSWQWVYNDGYELIP